MFRLLILVVLLLPFHVATESVGEESNPAQFQSITVPQVMSILAQGATELSAFNVKIDDRLEPITLFSVTVKKMSTNRGSSMNVPVVAHYRLRFQDVYKRASVCDHRGFVGHSSSDFAHMHSDKTTPSDCPKGYDMGHLAPAKAISWSEQSLSATYVCKNQVCQLSEVNRQVWKNMERLVRLMSWVNAEATIDVYVGPFDSDFTWRSVDEAEVPVFANLHMCVVCVEHCWWPLFNGEAQGEGHHASGFLFCMGHDNTSPPPPLDEPDHPLPQTVLSCPTVSNSGSPDNYDRPPETQQLLLDKLNQEQSEIIKQIQDKEDRKAVLSGPVTMLGSQAISDPAHGENLHLPPASTAGNHDAHMSEFMGSESDSELHEQPKRQAKENASKGLKGIFKRVAGLVKSEGLAEGSVASGEAHTADPHAKEKAEIEAGLKLLRFKLKSLDQQIIEASRTPQATRDILNRAWEKNKARRKAVQTGVERICIHTIDIEQSLRKALGLDPLKVPVLPKDVVLSLLLGYRNRGDGAPALPEPFDRDQMPWDDGLIKYLKYTLSEQVGAAQMAVLLEQKKAVAQNICSRVVQDLQCVNSPQAKAPGQPAPKRQAPGQPAPKRQAPGQQGPKPQALGKQGPKLQALGKQGPKPQALGKQGR